MPVTTPRSSHSTDACAAISDGAAIQPSPKPATKEAAATVQGFGHGPLTARPRQPTTAIMLPHSTVDR